MPKVPWVTYQVPDAEKWPGILKDPAYQFKCDAYGAVGGPILAESPDVFWRRIDLTYPDGSVLALVYEADPGDAEMRALMWKLQSQVPPGSTIRITHRNGSTENAAVFRRKRTR
jgi:hypothetical protein